MLRIEIFTQPVGPGIYLIDVGHYQNAPGPPRLKIGMSESNVLRRLEAHLRNARHERCVVHYCFPVEPSDSLTWHIPQMLEHLLHANLTLNGAEQAKETDDYFTWSDELLEQCIAYLNGPGLVDQIHRLIANPCFPLSLAASRRNIAGNCTAHVGGIVWSVRRSAITRYLRR